MAAILTNGVLKIRTTPIFQPLLAPARYKGFWERKGSRCTPTNAAHSPPPAVASTGSSSPRSAKTAKLTLSQLINRLLPQRTPVRHRRSNRRRLVRPNNQITRALAPPQPSAAALADASQPHPRTRATFPSFVTRYRAGDNPITSINPSRIPDQPLQNHRPNRTPLGLVHPPKIQMLTQRPTLQHLQPLQRQPHRIT